MLQATGAFATLPFVIYLLWLLPSTSSFVPAHCAMVTDVRNVLESFADASVGYLPDLDLAGRGISSLSSQAFIRFENVSRIDLRKNQIQFISPGAFHGLSALTTLFGCEALQIATCSNVHMHRRLSHNHIASVEKGMLLGMPLLDSLFLDHNRIEVIGEASFDGLSSLHSLWLTDNLIGSIKKGMFDGLSSLDMLWLYSNRIESIDNRAFSGMSSLSELWLMLNHIVSIKKGMFDGMPSLTNLYCAALLRWLQNNRIESIDKGAFAGMASLFKLSLSYNHIASVEIGMFCGMSSLAELWLDCNRIRTIEGGAFAGLTSLKKLVLAGNPVCHPFATMPSGSLLAFGRMWGLPGSAAIEC